jgi:hypothetical protein
MARRTAERPEVRANIGRIIASDDQRCARVHLPDTFDFRRNAQGLSKWLTGLLEAVARGLPR